MKSFVVISAIALSASALSSCLTTQEPTCNSTSYVPIVSAIGPKTVGVNQPAVFAIGYTLGSSCGTLGNVSAVPNANGSLVQVGVSANYVGCSCSPTTTVSQTTYQFQAATAGTYRIQFLSGNNIFITDTVIVK